MKKDGSASNFASGNGAKITTVICVLFSLTLMSGVLPVCLSAAATLKNYSIDNIFFVFPHKIELARISRYKTLLHLKSGAAFNYRDARKSMDNIYKVGSCDNIEIDVKKKPGRKLDVYFKISNKYLVRDIKVALKNPSHTKQVPASFPLFSKRDVQSAIFSLRKNTYFEEDKLDDAAAEVKRFLHSRGYFNPGVTYKVNKNNRDFTAAITFIIIPGPGTAINRVDVNVAPPDPANKIRSYFQFYPGSKNYVPYRIDERIAKVKRYLKKQGYYFPGITVQEQFLPHPPSRVNLDILVKPGPRYAFRFEGMKSKAGLISSIWEKKVFEKWAEGESKARILYHLKNKGYLDAAVTSAIEEKNGVKTITFFVDKKQKYALGKIHFQGNRSISEKELRKIIKTDDLLFEKVFHMRLDPLLVDQEVLRFYYIFHGFPSAQVVPRLEFRSRRADICFEIEEGKRFTVESVLFTGNRFFTSKPLTASFQTRANRPYARQTLAEDIEKLKTLYLSHGFDNITINADVSGGTEKSILIHIDEGKAYRLGNLVVIGASTAQRNLITALFPLEKGAPYDRTKIDVFKAGIENKAIFNQFKILKIEKETGIVDVLIKVNPDSSKYYGFGIGWEERKDFRVTVEYQERNIFDSYSTLSLMFQLGLNEKRGMLAYDTPYFFKKRLNSSFKVWIDSEIYPSYEFDRYGLGETLIKKMTPNSYLMASLNWYRTELTKLAIFPHGVDVLYDPFDTTAFNLSYVREKRDDSFNPTQGSFFSSNLKIGLPLVENYSFIKLFWRYQKNFKILSNGTIAASVRNGLASGDMSITERFFAGGVNTFRGSGRDRLGPLDPGTGKPEGGNAMVLFNFETTFPILVLPINDLYYSVFADFGNIFGKVKDIDLKHLESAVGISLKYKTQMGPLRFDVAWNLRTGQPEFHIGIGNVF